MSNVAYTDQYKRRWDEYQPLFIDDYIKQVDEYQLSDKYLIRVQEYSGKVGKWNLCGSECSLVNKNGKSIVNWRSVDNNSDFYQIITHSNGKEYLIFRQDLYGYSILDIASGEIMQFFPEASLNGGETFIWTGVEYNPINNILAVSGCYWACPFSTHLFTFDNPVAEQQKYVDLIECFDGDYDIYDDVSFVKWDNGDLHITRYVIETKTNEPLVIKQNEYITWISEKGQVL